MEKLSKKYKVYLSCLGVLFVIGIIFIIYSADQRNKCNDIAKCVDDMISRDTDLSNKLELIKTKDIVTIGDNKYVENQLQEIWIDNVYLESRDKKSLISYLNQYTQIRTSHNTYKEYYDYLNRKYNLTKDDGKTCWASSRLITKVRNE